MLENLALVAKTLGVSVSELIQGSDPTDRKPLSKSSIAATKHVATSASIDSEARPEKTLGGRFRIRGTAPALGRKLIGRDNDLLEIKRRIQSAMGCIPKMCLRHGDISTCN